MLYLPQVVAVAAVCLFSTSLFADTVSTENGGDTFASGSVFDEVITTDGDTFIAARTAVAKGSSQGDLHVAGFDITVSSNTQRDLYALGATVVVNGAIAEDLTAAGFSVKVESTSKTSGNARIMGRSVTFEGPVTGALSIIAQDVILNAPVAGDVLILAKTISFGPQAVVGGSLTYSAKNKIAVPERVAPGERVVYKRPSGRIDWDAYRDVSPEFLVFPVFASILSGFVISLLFFLALGALMLGFMPKRLERMRQGVVSAPSQTFLLGIVGLSMLFGMVPITGLTIVGLPLVPIIVLVIVTVWILGYALGAYTVAMRIWSGFGGEGDPSNISRLLVFAAGITAIALLHFIPFVGWVANYTLVLLGIGAITRAVFQRLMGNPGEAFDIDMKPIED
jgi:hypothetical protein